MIKRSILVFLVLIATWAIIIRVVPFSVSQHQWQWNIINAEKYIYSPEPIECVIVGSSLSTLLQMDSLTGVYNLALRGQGVIDGLNVLRLKKELPERVFVEINYIDRNENAIFSDLVGSPVSFSLKKNFRVLRADQQPLAAVGSGIIILVSEFISGISKTKNGAEGSGQGGEADPSENDEFFNELLDLQKATYSEPIDTAYMNQQFEILFDHFQFLKSNGVDVILYEMPVNHQLTGLSKASYIRNWIMEDFPEYYFIQLPDNWESVITSDGLHLTEREASDYTQYLKYKLAN